MRTSIEWAAGCADGRQGHSINPFRARGAFGQTGGAVKVGYTGHHCVKISPG